MGKQEGQSQKIRHLVETVSARKVGLASGFWNGQHRSFSVVQSKQSWKRSHYSHVLCNIGLSNERDRTLLCRTEFKPLEHTGTGIVGKR